MAEKIVLDLFTQYTFLSAPELSPDGKHIAFCAKHTELEQNRYRSNLWVHNIADNRTFQLTGLDDAGKFLWVDDHKILFAAVRHDQDKKRKKQAPYTVFYEIDIRGGEGLKKFSFDLRVTGIKPLDEKRFLLVAFDDLNAPDLSELEDDAKGKALKQYQDDQKIHATYEEIPFWGNGVGRIDGCRNRLYLFNSEDSSCKRLTEDYFTLEGLELNSTKTEALILGETYRNKAPITNTISRLNLETGEMKPLSRNTGHGMVAYLNDDTAIFSATDGKRYGINENHLFYTIDLKTETISCITPELDISLWNSVGSDCRLGGGKPFQVDGEKLYFVTTQGFNSHLHTIDATGKLTQITDQTGSIDSFSVKNGVVYYIALRGTKLQELYTLKAEKECVVTDFNNMIDDYSRSNYEYLSIKRGDDGAAGPERVVDGWVLKPVDYEPGKKYPAILDIHGGPKTVYGEIFYHEMQLWANMGYFVFFSNPVGGDGKGNQFADIRGKFGDIDYDDLMAFTDAVVAKYSDIDPDRLGVTGGSYGGFMTNWIIGQTDRFKAAASQRSIASWSSMFGTTDIGYYFAEDQMASGIWDNFDLMWKQSPIKYANKVKTPTLFIHSEEDYRCWVVEGIQMFTALKYFDVPSRLCILKGENHDLSRSGRPKQRIKRLEEITNWFEKYLKA